MNSTISNIRILPRQNAARARLAGGLPVVALVLLFVLTIPASGQEPVELQQIETQQTETGAAQPSIEVPITGDDAPPRPEREARVRKKFSYEKFGGIVYKRGDDYRLTCDVYVPEGEGPYPAVLAIHGGAWRSGSKLHMLRHAWRLAGRGYVVVAINYRHAPKDPWPAQIHDSKTAVRWMRSEADSYKIDPDRIGAFGYSAGGHLSALLATTGEDDGLEGEVAEDLREFSSNINCAVCGGAPCEFSWFGNNSRSLSYWLGDTPAAVPEVYNQAAPMTYIDGDDVPLYFFHGKSDMVVPLSTSEKMVEALNAAGVDTTYVQVEGQGHFAAFSDIDNLDDALEFLDRVLKNENATPRDPDDRRRETLANESSGVDK